MMTEIRLIKIKAESFLNNKIKCKSENEKEKLGKTRRCVKVIKILRF